MAVEPIQTCIREQFYVLQEFGYLYYYLSDEFFLYPCGEKGDRLGIQNITNPIHIIGVDES